MFNSVSTALNVLYLCKVWEKFNKYVLNKDKKTTYNKHIVPEKERKKSADFLNQAIPRMKVAV